jgi:hypothetical protein
MAPIQNCALKKGQHELLPCDRCHYSNSTTRCVLSCLSAADARLLIPPIGDPLARRIIKTLDVDLRLIADHLTALVDDSRYADVPRNSVKQRSRRGSASKVRSRRSVQSHRRK